MKRIVWGCLSIMLVACGANEEPKATANKSGFENPGGMWVPAQLGTKEHAKRLKALGLAIDPAQLSNPLEHPLGAIVHLGGCTASFVSPDGLIITNHHCVQSALQYNSTPEQNLIQDGFLAKSRAEEKWNGPGSRVYVTQKLSDVTDTMRAGIEEIEDPRTRYLELEKREKTLLADCERDRPELRCQVASYDGGTRYLLIERRQLNDVRLVHAPPASVGRYGGEIDNWMWPRHTGDYSFYRAYVAPDGSAAEHSQDNVPYQPKHYLKLPSEPLRAGELVFVAGYPGRTYRNYTAAEADEVTEWYYPRRVTLAEEYLKALERSATQNEEAKIRATPLRRGLENVLKYTRGALEGLTQGGAAAERSRIEAALKTKDPELFAALAKEFEQQKETRELDAAVAEFRLVKLLNAVDSIVRMAEERPKADAERKPGFQERDKTRQVQAQERLERTYSRANDIELLTLATLRAARHTPDSLPRVVKALLGEGKGEAEVKVKLTEETIRNAVSEIYTQTTLEDAATRVKLLSSASSAELASSSDPLLKLAQALRLDRADAEARGEAKSGRMQLLRPRYLALLKSEAGREVAPDANSTLRVTYGTVRGYRKTPEAEPYYPFTSLSEMAAKATDKEPFDAPKSVLEAAKSPEQGEYFDKGLGDVPVNFLSDLDITGGNSGSPTINRKGEIVGLAFDGNYEAMASDWLFMPDITRSISVDIRYVLWLMDTVLNAGHLVDEMAGTDNLALNVAH